MLVAVTGADGFLGRALVDRLKAAGVSLRVSDLETLDVRRPVPSDAFAGCEVVVHLAALTGVAPSMGQAGAYHRTNADGTAHVVAAAAAGGVRRVVVASSSSVYGECPWPAAEGRELRPLSPYATSKAGAEEAVAAVGGPGLERVVVRPFTVYGPGQRPDMLIARLLAGEAGVRLFGFVRDFTYVDEVVDGLVAALTAPVGRQVEVCNLGSGRQVAAGELLDALEEVCGRRPAVAWGSARVGEPMQTWADPERARAWLGLGEPVALVDGLRRQQVAVR